MARALIGVTGRKRSGKDTFAQRLVEAHGYTRVAFADILRQALAALDPLVRIEEDERGLFGFRPGDAHRHFRLSTLLETWDWETVKATREGRRLLQAFGTEAGRRIYGENVWVDLTAAKVDAIPGPVVITDVRFPNEADYIEESFGVLVRVERPGLELSADLHPSETALDDREAEWTIRNAGTIDDLHRAADNVVRYAHL